MTKPSRPSPFYTEKKLAELDEHRGKLVRQYMNLVFRCQARKYSSERGKEYAVHGFGRRLDLLRTAIDQVFTALPPERDSLPEREEILTATIAIQAFVLNVVGCVDNLAWVWVYERGVKASNGAELDRKSVGLWKREIQTTMSEKFRVYLDERKPWFESINNFRDALAHRIPLYIPPYGVEKSNIEEHNRLEDEATAALVRGDHLTYDGARDAQKKLANFRPVITHSYYEPSGVVYFHFQLLSDWLTIEELALKLFDESDGQP
jgi:hypothetical protein